jgi:hypothetical protein
LGQLSRSTDPAGNDVTYIYGTSGDETGRVTDIQDGSGRQQISYDEMDEERFSESFDSEAEKNKENKNILLFREIFVLLQFLVECRI